MAGLESLANELSNSELIKAETSKIWGVIENWILIQKLASDDTSQYDKYFLTWQQSLVQFAPFIYSVNLCRRLFRPYHVGGKMDIDLMNARIRLGKIEVELHEDVLGKSWEYIKELKRWDPILGPFPTGKPGNRKLVYRLASYDELRDFLFALDDYIQKLQVR